MNCRWSRNEKRCSYQEVGRVTSETPLPNTQTERPSLKDTLSQRHEKKIEEMIDQFEEITTSMQTMKTITNNYEALLDEYITRFDRLVKSWRMDDWTKRILE